ncbi:CsiV family protein [Marinomonas sp.]|uniref:CsiV family protein n=1 Tax=Marinomonas sp. TaxID=1904862 RepID=UPI003BAA80EB
MKSLIVIFLSLIILNTRLYAAEEQINPDTARPYEGYLVTFQWPEGLSTEQVDYKNVLSPESLLRITSEEEKAIDPDNNTDQSTPFGNIEERLGRNVKILANQKWTLIFRFPGDTIEKSFHSKQEKDGYPELTGNIAIKLGRYLESDIQYKHYLFDSFTRPDPIQSNEQAGSTSIFSQAASQPEFKEFEPALVLKLNQSNKTASKKVNYLDHPIIGTLIYFEPIELEDAIEKIAAQSVTPETGKSLTYDSLQSTNELTNR